MRWQRYYTSRVNLSDILRDLGTRAGPSGTAVAPTPEAVTRGATFGELVDATHHAGFGVVCGLLGLIGIPLIGLGLPIGLAIALGGAQMLIGREQPWLPRRLRRLQLSPKLLLWLGNKLARGTARLERVVRPRHQWLTQGPMWSLVGFGIMVQGLGLALPLPLPGANLMFIIPILFYSLGLLEDDGVLLALGHIATIIDFVLAILFYGLVARYTDDAVRWIGSLFA
jgi:hypothetical protein